VIANGEPSKVTGPWILAVDPWASSKPVKGKMHQLLTEEERARLSTIASVVRFKKGAEIYRGGDSADAIFNIISGVVKSCSGANNDHIVAFLFPSDLIGLSAEGTYINSARAITPVTAYRLPVSALRGRLLKDALLEYHVICKLCQELRQTQRHAFLLAQRHAESKIAAFLQMLEHLQNARSEAAGEIYIPMDRSDIAEYVGMSLAAVSRTFGRLADSGIVASRDRRHAKVVDREIFERIAAGGTI
jgi:CRP/FNR family transcriptional regulator